MTPRSDTGKRVMNGTLAAAICAVLAMAAAGQVKPAPAPVQTASPVAEDKRKAAHADADRLLALAQELKDSVEKSRKDELNVQVIREAEEIEKLARSLRSRVQ